ncbi:uncharacterized protein CDV56_104141 [Aspergillus thermomutatus]|uniref:Uncharacterized protein n=1 Tax=Aspergillus thermomutatus TaxID=41047 RepID=A0A397G8V8_ASPTH|nr:uncharacterized protein CDV56_104141 [Aspergillus thermomutatus]RHZ47445.1 hypothetical protein CDV56_104141 [Aspergillus thermomutatus]
MLNLTRRILFGQLKNKGITTEWGAENLNQLRQHGKRTKDDPTPPTQGADRPEQRGEETATADVLETTDVEPNSVVNTHTPFHLPRSEPLINFFRRACSQVILSTSTFAHIWSDADRQAIPDYDSARLTYTQLVELYNYL